MKQTINMQNFEKIVVGSLLILVTCVAMYKYEQTGLIDQGIIYLIGLLLTSFVVRKGLSYWKPDKYYQASNNNNNAITKPNILPDFWDPEVKEQISNTKQNTKKNTYNTYSDGSI